MYNTLIFCETVLGSKDEPAKIICRNSKKRPIAEIFNGQQVRFITIDTLSLAEMQQIYAIVQNFGLFYDNIQLAEAK